MADDDLIRRGDALEALQLGDTLLKMQGRIRAIPSVDADPVCTCCGGTGITYQTERRCACQPAKPAPTLPEVDIVDAPLWLNGDAAYGWVCGYNEALRRIAEGQA